MNDHRRASWAIIDNRTGERCAVASFFTEDQAVRAIGRVHRNVESGRRPDLADVAPHLEPRLFDVAA